MIRLIIDNDSIMAAQDVLDANLIPNDMDDGDRIMVHEDDIDEAISLLEKMDIDVDVV